MKCSRIILCIRSKLCTQDVCFAFLQLYVLCCLSVQQCCLPEVSRKNRLTMNKILSREQVSKRSPKRVKMPMAVQHKLPIQHRKMLWLGLMERRLVDRSLNNYSTILDTNIRNRVCRFRGLNFNNCRQWCLKV